LDDNDSAKSRGARSSAVGAVAVAVAVAVANAAARETEQQVVPRRRCAHRLGGRDPVREGGAEAVVVGLAGLVVAGGGVRRHPVAVQRHPIRGAGSADRGASADGSDPIGQASRERRRGHEGAQRRFEPQRQRGMPSRCEQSAAVLQREAEDERVAARADEDVGDRLDPERRQRAARRGRGRRRLSGDQQPRRRVA
jgi:hypothetical protein